MQGTVLLLLAPIVGVPYSRPDARDAAAIMPLRGASLTAFGVLAASRMQQVESFQVVMQLLVLPMFFLAGAIFPLNDLPAWLSLLTKIDPLAYIVDPMRRAVFAHFNISPAAMAASARACTGATGGYPPASSC